MPSRELQFLLKPLKEIAEGGFEAAAKIREIRNCFPVIVSYCCVFLKRNICLHFSTELEDGSPALRVTAQVKIR